MLIKICDAADVAQWARLRASLWPSRSIQQHRQALAAKLDELGKGYVGFLALSQTGDAVGFAEAALRHDHVNGCETSPVVFLEGIYVRPEDRRQGVAKRLCEAVEAWGVARGCSEFGSDALVRNIESHEFLTAMRFRERETVVFFRKLI